MDSLELGELKVNQFGERFYTGLSQLNFAKQSSESVFQHNYRNLLEVEDGLVIFVGSDSGLLYRYLNQKALKPHQRFIIIEFEDVISALDLDEKAKEWSGSVRLVDESFDFSRLADKEFESYLIRKKITLAKSLAVTDAKAGSAYKQLFDKVEVDFRNFYSPHLVSQNAKQFEHARLINAVDNIFPLKKAKGTLEGATAIILGGGPTLDDSIDWIRANQDSLIIFAAGRIAGRLVAERIKPDFFVSVDPQEEGYDNTKGIIEFRDRATLITSYHVSPKILSQWPGAVTYAGLKYGWENKDYTENIEIPGPTVTNAALGAAYALGCDSFILAGVDFCYAYGRTHEASSDEVRVGAHLHKLSPYEVVNNAGEVVRTEYGYASARDNMEFYISQYLKAKPDLQFVSLGLASAKIENVLYVDKSALTLESFDKQKIEDLRKLFIADKAEYLSYAKKTVTELKAQKTHFFKIKSLANEGLGVLPKLYKEGSDTPKFKAMARIQKLRKKLNRLIGEDGDLLMNYDTSYFYDSFKPVEDESNIQSNEVVDQFQGLFQGVISSVDEYVKIIDLSIKRANLRLDELSDDVSVCQLLHKWREFGEFGRALRWSNWHEEKNLTANEKECLKEAITAFEEELKSTDTKQVNRLKKASHNPAVLLTRAQDALEKSDSYQLEDIKVNLSKIDDSETRIELGYLVNGMLYELAGSLDLAIEAYSKTSLPLYNHVALKRVLQITMEQRNHQASLETLEALCRYSLDYMVPYADLLDLLGQSEMSIEVLKLYVSQNPGKLNAQLKLAQKLIQLNQNYEAENILQTVLEKEPENQTAKHLLKILNS